MNKIVTHTRVPHKSRRSIAFMCLALFSIAATGSAQNLLTKTGGLTADPLQAIDQYGAIGSGKGLSLSGAILDAPLTSVITEVTSGTGRIWMDRNLGATQVATSSTDAASYGDLYQWGRGTDGHQIRTSGTTTVTSTSTSPGNTFVIGSPPNWYTGTNPDNLWQGLSGINNPCPSGYLLPTQAEWEAERLNWSSNNAAGAFASPLILPLGGYRSINDGSLTNVGISGVYWSSTVSSTTSFRLNFLAGGASMFNVNRANGLAVRCIKATNIIISATGKVWMDRNLGATQVATSSTDTNAYGDLYQWGRGTDGHQSRTSGTTSTLSSTDSPGNVGFITTTSNSPTFDWRSPKNDNLWQGVNGVNNPCPSGFRLPTSTEWNAEITKWISNDAAGAFASLKLPVAGRRYFLDGVISLAGTSANYWSSTVGSDDYPISLSFHSSYAGAGSGGYRGWGFSVRCIMD